MRIWTGTDFLYIYIFNYRSSLKTPLCMLLFWFFSISWSQCVYSAWVAGPPCTLLLFLYWMNYNKDTGRDSAVTQRRNSVASFSWKGGNFLSVLENQPPKNPDYSHVPTDFCGAASSHTSFWTQPLRLLQIRGLNTIHTATWQQNSYWLQGAKISWIKNALLLT